MITRELNVNLVSTTPRIGSNIDCFCSSGFNPKGDISLSGLSLGGDFITFSDNMFKGLICSRGFSLEGDTFLLALSIRGDFGTVFLFLSGLSLGSDFITFSDSMFKGLSCSSGFSLEEDALLFALSIRGDFGKGDFFLSLSVLSTGGDISICSSGFSLKGDFPLSGISIGGNFSSFCEALGRSLMWTTGPPLPAKLFSHSCPTPKAQKDLAINSSTRSLDRAPGRAGPARCH